VRRWLFWGSGGLLAYTYLGFPALVLARAALVRRPYRTADVTPTVSIVIAVHNEASVIEAKLANLLALDYPRDRLEIVIASDGSDDATEEIIRACTDPRVQLLALPRVGKAAALNAAIAAAQGEVIVFSDANSMFEPDAVRVLVRPLADLEVGGVAGNQVYGPTRNGDGSDVGERQYWSFDRLLKTAQSRAGSVTGATGAIYAIRHELVHPLRGDVNDDLLNSLRVIAQGRRLVFSAGAVAVEPVSDDVSAVFSRRVRVMVRGLRCVLVERELLDPTKHGFFSLQLLSHKVLLRTAVFPLFSLAVSAPLLWRRGRVYRAATIAQGAFYLLGASGLVLAERPVGKKKVLALPAFFCLVNAASAKAVWQLVRGERMEQWSPERPEDSDF
jgi:cellulose synthase/poly-beta-1,6-N-acetylglucosamine synthase-like glycosyltransferase